MDHKVIVIGATSVVAGAVGSVAGYILAKKRLEQKYEGIADRAIAEADRLYQDWVEVKIQEVKQEYDVRFKKGKFETPEAVLNHFNGKREVTEPEREEDIPDDLTLETRGQRYRADVAAANPHTRVFPQRVPQPIEEDEFIDVAGIQYRRKELNLNGEQRSELSKAAEEALGQYKSDHPDYEPPWLPPNHNIFVNDGTPNHGGEEVPHVISSEEFMEDSDHDSVTLTYYVGDDTLADEREEPIQDVDETVGEHNLGKFGERSGDPNVVYIRNDFKRLNIELIRSPGRYSKEVLGLEDDDAAIGVVIQPRSVRSHRKPK